VLSRGAKLILGLIVLLAWPCLGWGSRVEASFALGRSVLPSERSASSPGFELQLVLNGGETSEPEVSYSSWGTGKETTPLEPHDSPRAPLPPRDILSVLAGSFNTGASSTSAPPVGPGSGAGLSFILPLGSLVSRASQSGLLFLADERLDSLPFASRLFRPPR